MCGITGVFAPGRDAARLAFFALYALQHRGQESAGIAAADGGTIRSHKEMGLLGAIFDEDILSELSGHIAIGHTRYSTTRLLHRRQRAAAARTIRSRRLRLRAQRQPDQYRRASRNALADDRTPGQLRFRGNGEADRRVEGHDGRADRVGARACARRVLDRALHARPSSTRFATPGACGRSASDRLNDGGGYRRRLGIVCVRNGRRAVRARDRARRDRSDRRPTACDSYQTPVEREQQALCMFEYIYFARPDSQVQRAVGLHGALCDGPASRAGASRRGRRRDGGARLGGGRRHRVCGRERTALYRGLDQEPLYRADLHQPRSAHARARRAS